MRLALIFNGQREGTTGRYLERAGRALGLGVDRWELRDADRIPAEYDLYLRVDHGDEYLVQLPAALRPSAFYAIDTHLPHSWRKIRRAASWYDLVFCCHRRGAEGIKGAVWLPVACDWELHGPREQAQTWDLAFVGTDGGVPRKFYLQALRERYPNSFLGTADSTRLSSLYGRAKIGFNYSIADDVNMRTFEVPASGALLVTNALSHGDLQALGLEDRRHLALYRSPRELFEMVDYYLARPEERQRIAAAGLAVVRDRHTYTHRMQQLLAVVSQRLGGVTQESLSCGS